MVEEFCYFVPVGRQMLEKLGAEVDPILDTAHQLARQHRVFRKKLYRYFPARQMFCEMEEPLCRRGPLKLSLKPGYI